ncbi:hypothetical protein WMF30_09485 [Sorangium sp. So ce134]
MFYVIANVPPAPSLATDIATTWPADVRFRGPGDDGPEAFLPPSFGSVNDLFRWCVARAETVPLRAVGADTLVWKLAAMVQAACAGERRGHTFVASDLPELFEQLVVQLQQFPASPRPYRPHEDEPPCVSDARVRLVVAPSGAGKSAWAAHVSENAPESLVYYDVALGQGGALAAGITREIAARLFESDTGALRTVLLPGATGLEALTALGKLLAARSARVTVFLDNVHLADVAELASVVGAGEEAIRWVLLAQPWAGCKEIEARAAISSERLEGWSIETISAAFADQGVTVSPEVAVRVYRLTGGLPLFVRELVHLAKGRAQAVDVLCTELEEQAHLEQTRQEAILLRTLAQASAPARLAATALASADIPLEPSEVATLLQDAGSLAPPDATRAVRELGARGALSQHRDGRVAVHDAFRLAILAAEQDGALVRRCRRALQTILLASLRRKLDADRLLAFLRLLPSLGELKAFVDIVSTHGEQIHELGLTPAIERFVRAAAQDPSLAPEDRFWAFDVIAFLSGAKERSDALAAMSQLLSLAGDAIGRIERLSFLNKTIIERAEAGELREARDAFAAAMQAAETRTEKLIIRYTLAHACFICERWREVEGSALELVAEYYDILGLEQSDVRFQNPGKILLKLPVENEDLIADLKRVADCHALVAMSRERLQVHPGFARIDAMKFYEMAQAPVSAVRMGLDAASDFLRFGDDLEGAHAILDKHVEPFVKRFRLAGFVAPLGSMRAVLLAYEGRSAEARALIERLTPLADGMTGPERDNFMAQSALVRELAADPRRWLRR